MDTPPNPKRPCLDISSSSIQQNPNPFPTAHNHDFDSTITSFLLLPYSDSDAPSMACSLDQVVDQVLSSASCDDSLKARLIDSSSKLVLLLHESIKRFTLKEAFLYNNNSWSLPHDLTIKVFSMLDTKSMIRAASCCTMFRKWAMDPSFYAHIDLIMENNVNDKVVCSMIDRAGKELRSLKLVRVASIPSRKIPGLVSLFYSNGVNGGHLKSLHLDSLVMIGIQSLCALLSPCHNLTDLKIVDLKLILTKVLKTLTSKTRSSKLKHVYLQKRTEITASGTKYSTLEAFVTSCPDLTSLTLKGFRLSKNTAQKIALGFPQVISYLELKPPKH